VCAAVQLYAVEDHLTSLMQLRLQLRLGCPSHGASRYLLHGKQNTHIKNLRHQKQVSINKTEAMQDTQQGITLT
jgi:hypothetical protein